MPLGLRPDQPPRPPSDQITAFAFSGRLAIQQGEKRHHVRIDWQHEADRDEVLLTTPLGQGVAEITRDARGARLLLADKREFSAADWNALAEQVFGFRLPLDSAPRWLLGLPVDVPPWKIAVVEREGDVANALPETLELEHGDILVRLKIDEWSEVR